MFAEDKYYEVIGRRIGSLRFRKVGFHHPEDDMVRKKSNLRNNHGYREDDMLILVLGSLFFYNGLSWDYADAMHLISLLLKTYAKREDAGGSFKFLFLCGNSSETYSNALQELTSRLGLPQGLVKHYGVTDDVNSLLLMSDIALCGSSQEFQEFPPLLIRAMSFGIPIVVPDYTVTNSHIVDGIHGMIYPKYSSEALIRVFSQLVTDGKLSDLAKEVASNGKKAAKNILALDCINGYAKLFENLISFSSDVTLPITRSPGKLGEWDWEWILDGCSINLLTRLMTYIRSGRVAAKYIKQPTICL